jgi:LPXTG-motif cell wall-anchored protein
MSLTRRLAAGLPAAGVAAFAVLAFASSPASAASADSVGAAGRPAVMASPTCTDEPRSKCGYGYHAAPDHNGAAPAGSDTAGPGADDNGNTDHRGHPGSGYGSVSPSTSPTPSASTPTGNTDTVPPGGVSPTTLAPSETPGGGVSAGGTLPLTGAPMGLTLAFGALLVAAGAGAVWYTRRRRSA